ncbi:NAD(P)H-hydrate dehydratase [Oceaniglobus roseus]|uniref:NAD(P)H-hydrate dehydratase n=1 Tax=Oceaniglobus roseus TaxID=1737570 RepID=UPI000C7E8DAE|nr:NAD(P)H-hydrate dehydratase [Kandeliimicrobium roseum]
MSALLTSAEMRALEQAAITGGSVTGLELMERAGRGAVEAMLAEWPALASGGHRAAVLCGPGNNGGDGFVVARLLHDRGWEITLYLFGDPAKLPPDARTNHDRWCQLGKVLPWPGPDTPHDPRNSDLIVDALFGTGLTRGLSFDSGFGSMLPGRDLRNQPGSPRVVALDVPSGLCSDSGRLLEGDALRADLTVSFHSLKAGHVLAEGPHLCGKVAVCDIGLSGPGGRVARLVGPPHRQVGTRADPFGRPQHKFDHGHALVLSGGVGHGGAARMAARGALRIGAGLVTVGCPPAALIENAAQLTAIMLKSVKDADALADMLEDSRLNALCAGPGLGLDPRAAALVGCVLKARRPTVLDGDALTLVARDPELFAVLHRDCVLTPHGGEFARLFPDIADRLAEPEVHGPAYSRLDAARAAAARAGACVLLKGPDTVIAAPDGSAAVHAAAYGREAPWLATAGAGDVLAGFIAGLLARGLPPLEAAENAAWLHVECALDFGPGLIAEDLPERLPAVLRRLSD